MAPTSGITIDEFELLPNALARNHELVNGELVDVSGNTPLHNRLRDRLLSMLIAAYEDGGHGLVIAGQEYDFDDNAHGPDISLIDKSKVHLLDRTKRVQRFVPDLAIEVVSKNDRFNALMAKAARYRGCGTKEAWVLAPEDRLAFVLSEGRREMLGDEQPFESPLVPGFSVRLGQLFDKAMG